MIKPHKAFYANYYNKYDKHTQPMMDVRVKDIIGQEQAFGVNFGNVVRRVTYGENSNPDDWTLSPFVQPLSRIDFEKLSLANAERLKAIQQHIDEYNNAVEDRNRQAYEKANAVTATEAQAE